jgi:soluble lytic murein transglycosylase-like protein
MPESTIADVACDAVPEKSIAPILLEAAQREGLAPKLLTAVIQQESAFRPCAISQKGAKGLMQLMPDTADRLSVKDPFDAKQNIDAGAKYLKELITRYSGNARAQRLQRRSGNRRSSRRYSEHPGNRELR